ncbi:MAG: cysteine--tRNA ligase [Terriglobales bacterium]
MEIRLRNTLTRQVEAVAPMDGRRLRMYTCGPTVYDYGHIGNFRTFVAVDLWQRFWRSQGGELEAVLNLTDIDDKMIERARAAGREVAAHAALYAQAFWADLAALGIAPPDHVASATAYIPAMVAWIERLVAGGHAYASEGSVYFRVASFPAYGRLSGKDLEGLQTGARVQSDTYDKEAARDFVLWKAQKPGEPSWPSPWGPGRPGWHIECTVMSAALLGESFDLHAGGADLIFPHHENEIAQAEAATGKPFVCHWMHVEFLLVNGEKMSKSLGNFFTLRDLIGQGHRPSSIRYLLASVPYHRQLNFTLEGLQQAAAAVSRLRLFQDRMAREAWPAQENLDLSAALRTGEEKFSASLADDLNTSEALAGVFEALRQANSAMDAGAFGAVHAAAFSAWLARFDAIFGVLQLAEQEAAQAETAAVSDATVEAKLAERAAARARRDFARSDALRAELEAGGIMVEDRKSGVVWRRK